MAGQSDLTPQAAKYMEEDLKLWPSLVKDSSEGVLMTSRAGSESYQRTFMEGWIRPGLHFRNWTSRTNYPACGVVQTGPSEMSVYVTRHYAQHDARLQRYALRLDGFASLHADAPGGEMISKPLRFTGKELHANFSTGASGGVAVELQDAQGQPIPGFTLQDCEELSYDDIDRVITWRKKGSPDLSSLAGKAIRIRWVLRDADVFSFKFE
jgi:hypothetical protein